jgi:hypothetical protein
MTKAKMEITYEMQLTDRKPVEMPLNEKEITEIRLTEIRLTEIRLSEIRLSEIRLNEIRLNEIGPGYIFKPIIQQVEIRPLGIQLAAIRTSKQTMTKQISV